MTATPPPTSPDADDFEASFEDMRMSFGDHLQELRKRLILALVGVAVMFCVTMLYGSQIILWLLTPLVNAQRQAGLTPNAVGGITSGFTTYIVVAFIAALIISLPWVLYQLWQFVATGLYPSERKVVILLAPLSALMATIGILFLYYVLLPVGLFFFLSFTTSYPAAPPTPTDGLSSGIAWVNKWAVRLSGIPGWGKLTDPADETPATTQPASQPSSQPLSQPADIATPADPALASQHFSAVQIPVLTTDPVAPLPGQIWLKQPEDEVRIFLNNQIRTLNFSTSSIVTPLIQVSDYLSFISFMALGVVIAFQIPVAMLILGWLNLVQAAFLRKYRGHALLAILIIAAVITPPDPVTLLLLGVPMYALFELGMLFMAIANRHGIRREEDMAADI